MGAALTACGGESVEPRVISDPPGAGSGAGAQSGTGGAGGGSGGTVIIPAGGVGGIPPYVPVCERPGGGSYDAPLGPGDCAYPEQFNCSGSSCICDAEAPMEPTDCENTADFQCEDWLLPCGCTCVPGSPTTDETCPGRLQCRSYDPPVGCGCIAPIIL